MGAKSVIVCLLVAFCSATRACESELSNNIFPPGTLWTDGSQKMLEFLIEELYSGNINNGERIIRFIEKFQSEVAQIKGYRYLFNEIEKSKDLHSVSTMIIIYRVIEFQKKFPTDQDLSYMMKSSPSNVRSFPFHNSFYMKNANFREYAYASKFSLGEDRSHPFTWAGWGDCSSAQCYWELEVIDNGFGFRIFNKEANDYLVADRIKKDGQRRHVALMAPALATKLMGDVWQFEPVPDSEDFRVKNIFWGEYMYPNGYSSYNYDSSRRPLYTWIEKGCDSNQCHFHITKK